MHSVRLSRILRHIRPHFSRSSSSQASIHFSKNPCLIDEEIDIHISGLENQQRVTILATTREQGSGYANVFWSHATYQANENGDVNLQTDPPLSGSYKERDGMGLFWSMSPAPFVPPGQRLSHFRATAPRVFHFMVMPETNQPENFIVDHPPDMLAYCRHERLYKAEGVRRVPVDDHPNIKGTLFIPPGEGPFPGVIDMFGGLIPIMEGRAALLASRLGVVSLALSYVHYPGLPEKIADVDLSYFKIVTEWFQSLPEVDQSKMGVVGICVGGMNALHMADTNPNVKAAVAINCLPFLLPWKDGGKPAEKISTFDEKGFQMFPEGLAVRNVFTNTPENYFTPWKHGAKCMVIVCDDDYMIDHTYCKNWPDVIPEEAKDKMEFVFYEKAGHLLEPPFTPLCRFVDAGKLSQQYGFNSQVLQEHMLLGGGFPKEHATAQKDSWKKILEFLRSNLNLNSACS